MANEAASTKTLTWWERFKRAWNGLPGAVGKLTAVVAAVGTLIGTLNQFGLLPHFTSVSAHAPLVVAPPKVTDVSIAVLPFDNLSKDQLQASVSDGMAVALNQALIGIPGLNVVARQSALKFKDQQKDPREVARSLGVSHLIEGSVRMDGDHAVVSADLVDTGTVRQIWADTYPRPPMLIFDTRHDIVQAITRQLKLSPGSQQSETTNPSRATDPESYQQFLTAQAQLRDRSLSDAIASLKEVIRSDPNYAPAQAQLALANRLAPTYDSAVRTGSVPNARRVVQSYLDQGETAARKAIELDPESPTGFAMLAAIEAQSGKWADAEDHDRNALALDPSDPDVLHDFSQILTILGRLDEAMAVRNKLLALEPYVPVFNLVTADILQINGRSRDSIPILEEIPANGKQSYFRNVFLARAYAADKRFADAADTLLQITGNQVSRASVEEAARLLRESPKKSEPRLPLEGELNFVYLYIGTPDRVLENPERYVEVQSMTATGMRALWLPVFAPIRKTERFKDLMRAAHIEDYWRTRGWPDLCQPQGTGDFVCN